MIEFVVILILLSIGIVIKYPLGTYRASKVELDKIAKEKESKKRKVEYWENDTIETSYYKLGQHNEEIKHRDPLDGPAFVRTKNNVETEKEYWVDGKRLRTNNSFHRPAPTNKPGKLIIKYDDGMYSQEDWNNEKCQMKILDEEDSVLRESYFEWGELSRPFDEGPAEKVYGKYIDETHRFYNMFLNGKHRDKAYHLEAYYLNGEPRQPSDGGPSLVIYDEQGQLIFEEWGTKDKSFWYFKKDGKLHRPIADGPARIVRVWQSNEYEISYFEDGVFIPSDEVELRRKKAKDLAEFEKLPKPEQEYLMSKYNETKV